MGQNLISFPFTLSANGSVQTLDQDSDGYDQQQIGLAALTCQGERELAVGFGIPDPTWTGFSPGALSNVIRLYGPPVTLVSIDVVALDAQTQGVTVEFN